MTEHPSLGPPGEPSGNRIAVVSEPNFADPEFVDLLIQALTRIADTSVIRMYTPEIQGYAEKRNWNATAVIAIWPDIGDKTYASSRNHGQIFADRFNRVGVWSPHERKFLNRVSLLIPPDTREPDESVMQTFHKVFRFTDLTNQSFQLMIDHALDLRTGVQRVRIPSFAGESIDGEDLLEVRDDAAAIATLMTSNLLKPPLAIGVYGAWGSGKSFFMRSIAKETATLSTSGHPAFSQNVVNVWFNAWHYAESNLWASLLHEIFSSLHRAEPTAEKLLKEALLQVESVRLVKDEAEEHLQAARVELASAQTHLEEVQNQQKIAESATTQLTLKDVWSEVQVDDDLRKQLKSAAGDLGITSIGNSARDLAEAAQAVKSVVGRGRRLATAGRWYSSPLTLGLLTVVTIAVAGVVVSTAVDWSQSWLAPFIATASQLAGLLGGAATWIGRQAKLASKLLDPAERMQRRLDDEREKVARTHREAAAVAQQRLTAADAEVQEAQHKVDEAVLREQVAARAAKELTGPRLLERYLADRATSGDYNRYLGVVALAHRDLRDLEAHLQAAAGDSDSSIGRIVLYIDDLDRCTPETVVQVLEAVHLLLAQPLFVAVVGVDLDWLLHSLRHVHPALLGAEAANRTSPTEYLDKIFQLTYTVPTMSVESSGTFLREVAMATQPAVTTSASMLPSRTGDETAPADLFSDDDNSDSLADRSHPRAQLSALALEWSDAELDALGIAGSLVGVSPRRAKRFLNVYRVLKARALVDTDARVLEESWPLLLLIVAIGIGVPDARTIFAQADADDERTLGTLVQDIRELALEQDNSSMVQRIDRLLKSGLPALDRSISSIPFWLTAIHRFS